jgi:3-isopropylmalate/(R)-2-methylmalate dehydratase large subunit
MGMTMAAKILARAANQDAVKPGDLVNAKIRLALGNDITAPVAIKEFKRIGVERVFDPERVVLIPDHFTPNKDIQSAEQAKILREFAQEQKLTHYYEVGRMGVEHALVPELGLALPGEVIIGADSHTCTYGAFGALATGVGSTDLAAVMALGELWFKVPPTIKFIFKGKLKPWVGGKDLILFTIGQIGVDGARYMAMEFDGPVIKELSMEGRMTLCNMAIEAGGKCGLVAFDEKTEAYLQGRTTQSYTPVYADDDADYENVYEFNVSDLEPQVAFPHLPENTRPVSEAADVKIDQVVIGSCTNGRIEDLRVAAQVLKGKKVAPWVRMLVIPATQVVYKQTMEEGLMDIFIAAEAAVSTPTCGPCLGGHMGLLAAGERCLSTTNRNFVGRMGHPQSEVYLANPAVAAATAVKGYIAHPEEVQG